MFYSPKKTSNNSNDSVDSSFGDVPSEWGSVGAGDTSNEVDSYFAPQGQGDSPFGESAPGTPSSSTRNVLNQDVTVVGTLRFTDDLLVDGSVEGEITSEGVLTVGRNATIQADEKSKAAIRTKSAIIHGKVIGDVAVTDRVELTSTAELVGDVTADKISIQEGAVFVGHCSVGTASVTPLSTSQVSASAKRNAKRAVQADRAETPNLLG